MYLNRAQRKMMLLYARLLELCAPDASVHGGKVVKSADGEQFCLETGTSLKPLVSVRDIREWRAERKPQSTTIGQVDRAVTAVFPADSPRQHAVSDPDRVVDVFEFAQRIGISPARARYIIDYEYASKLPTYSAVTQGGGSAKELTLTHGGLYSLYRHDNNLATRKNGSPRGIITRSTLSIRYPVPYKPHDADIKGDKRVRCKLNVPGYGNHGAAPFKYDGYVASNRGSWSQFLFQGRPGAGRNPDSEDLILMYTEPFGERSDPSIPLRGVALTQNQSDSMNPSISTVVLVREPGYRIEVVPVPHPIRPKKNEYLPEYFSSYYALLDAQGKEVDEQDFMRGRLGILSVDEARQWSDTDARAVQMLFDGWPDLNIQGLHV